MKEKAKHTPGPWTVQIEGRHFVDIVVDTDDVLVIAEIDTHNIDAPPRTQCIANARLMAAAPDMLEALKKLASIDFGSNGWDEFAENAAREARAAIAKALGKYDNQD